MLRSRHKCDLHKILLFEFQRKYSLQVILQTHVCVKQSTALEMYKQFCQPALTAPPRSQHHSWTRSCSRIGRRAFICITSKFSHDLDDLRLITTKIAIRRLVFVDSSDARAREHAATPVGNRNTNTLVPAAYLQTRCEADGREAQAPFAIPDQPWSDHEMSCTRYSHHHSLNPD